jgi:hypothetical protein
MKTHIVYGIGGYNPDLPNNNVIEELITDMDNSEAWALLRERRNTLIAHSDWTQLPDASLSIEDKERWRVYRQALRDLPQNTVDPNNPVFPVFGDTE